MNAPENRTIITSKKYSLNRQDLLEGALLAGLSVFIATSGQILEARVDAWIYGTVFVLDKLSFALSVKASVAAFFSYIAKNFFRPAQTITIPPKNG